MVRICRLHCLSTSTLNSTINFYSTYNLKPDYLFSKINDEQEVLEFIQFAGFGNVEENAKMPATEHHLDPDFVNKYSVK